MAYIIQRVVPKLEEGVFSKVSRDRTDVIGSVVYDFKEACDMVTVLANEHKGQSYRAVDASSGEVKFQLINQKD